MRNFIPSYLLTSNQVKTPVADEGVLLVQLLDWGIRHAKTSAQRECAWHIVAAIVNKHSAGDEQLFSVAHGLAYPQVKVSTLFSRPYLPHFGTTKLPSHSTLMPGVVLFQHGQGCVSYRLSLMVVT